MLFRASIFWDMNQIQQANLIKWLLEEDKEVAGPAGVG
jgi:hypothetical protein